MPANKNNDANTFQIYVADLAAYNNGRLVGAWLTPSDYADAEALGEAIRAVLERPDNEYAIHDSQNVAVSEHESLENVMALDRAFEDWGAEKLKAALDHGIIGDFENISDEIAEHDGGEYSSSEDWAEEYISSAYDLDKLLGNLAAYFDYEAFARDAELGGDVSFVDLPNGNVWVINNH